MNHAIYIIDQAGRYRQADYLTAEERSLANIWEPLEVNLNPTKAPIDFSHEGAPS